MPAQLTRMHICAVTGSRADWGLLSPVLSRLRSSGFALSIIATGSHLDAGFGHTANAIEAQGFRIDAAVELDHAGDDRHAVAKRLAMAITGVTAALEKLAPDMLLVLGDRYEIFAAAQAASIFGIPIAHIAGGDISEGAYDDAIRHAISKLAHLHFTTNEAATRRVLQMGESPARVVHCGSPGIDAMLTTPRWSRERLEETLGFTLHARNLAVTFHTATLDPTPADRQVRPLLDALARLGDDTGLVFTGANADHGGQRINQLVGEFVARHGNACRVLSLGQQGYYTLLGIVDLVVGNSSSGLYEAPSLSTPSLDIGMRQQGRLRGPSVKHVENDAQAIHAAILESLQRPPTSYSTPYGDGTASERIVDVLSRIDDPPSLLVKHFNEIDQA